MKINQITPVSVGLSAVPPASAGLGLPLLLVDTTDVPIDRRYVVTSKSAFATDLSGAAQDWCSVLYGQGYNPANAYIGRWLSTAIAPAYVCPDPGSTIATWAAVTAGDFAITDGTDTEQFTTGTMIGCSTLAQVCAVIQTEVRTSVTFAAWAATATVALDALGRIVLTGGVTGASADTFSIIAPTGGSGTDITAAAYLNIAEGFGVAGYDAEGLDDALYAVRALTETPFMIAQIGGSIAQQVELATAAIASDCMLELVCYDADAVDSGASTDVGYLLNALTNNNVHICYTAHTGQYPDAAVIGRVCQVAEGSTSWAFKGLTSCMQSGLDTDGVTDIPLTDTERATLEAKGYDYLIKPSTTVHLRHGLCAGGVEARLKFGYYWLIRRVSEEFYAYLLTNNVVTFSDDDIQALGGILAKYFDVLIARKVIEPNYSLVLPSAASISATVKATHTLTLDQVAELISQMAVNTISTNLTATV